MSVGRRHRLVALTVALVCLPGVAFAQLTTIGGEFNVPSGGTGFAKTVDAGYDTTHDAFLVVTTEHRVGHVTGSFVSPNGGTVATAGAVGFRIDTSANFPFGPAIAYSVQTDRFLVVWVNDSRQVRGRFVQFGVGALGAGDFLIGTGGRNSWAPAVAYSETSQQFLVSWSTGLGPNKVVRVTTDGATIGDAVTVSGNIWTQEPALAWNPTNDEFMLTYAHESATGWRIHALRLRNGQPVGGPVLVHASGGTKMPDVAYSTSSGKYVVSWFQAAPYGIYGRTLNPDGSPASAVQPLLPSNYGSYDANSLSYNEHSDTFTVSTITPQSGTDTIGGTEVSHVGVPSSPMVFVPAAGRNRYYPEVAGADASGRFLAVFNRSLASFYAHVLHTSSSGGGGGTSGGGEPEPAPAPTPAPPPSPTPTAMPNPAMNVDAPTTGATTGSPFAVSGWAIDRGASEGTGVDAVHVWGYPVGGGTPVFAGAAAYGLARPDIANTYGSRFRNSGWALSVETLGTGTWRIEAFLHSTVTGTFVTSDSVTVTVGGPAMSFDAPANGTSFKGPYSMHGWAIDRSASSGTGVDTVHVWAYPIGASGLGTPKFVGQGEYGLFRTNVGAAYGDRFTRSGFRLSAMNLRPGQYMFAAFARSTVANAFNNVDASVATVNPGPLMQLDTPTLDQSVTPTFSVGGWAMDLSAATGSGVDAVHVWAYPFGSSGVSGSPVFVGAATMNVPRPDLVDGYGSRGSAAGFTLSASSLPRGRWMLAIFARSTVTRSFNNVVTTLITVR